MANNKKIQPITLDDVRIVFRNFSGAEGLYNVKGNRNFAAILEHDRADEMIREGWNVKYLKPREEGEEPQPYITVKIKFSENGRPPRAVLINSRGRTNLGEDEINIFDWADIAKVDLKIRAFQWDVQGKTGVTAYMEAIYVTINEDELELRYANVPESSSAQALTTGRDNSLEDMGEIMDEDPWGEPKQLGMR